MGWTFGFCGSKKSVIEKILSDSGASWRFLRHKTIGKNLWLLAENVQSGVRHIEVAVLDKEDKSWGYKIISENAGPYYYDCPLSFLNEASPPRSEAAKEWRALCLQWAKEQEAIKQAIRGGTVFELFGRTYTLVEMISPKKGWVAQDATGKKWHITNINLKKIKLIKKEEQMEMVAA
jgi:hypothetical protein